MDVVDSEAALVAAAEGDRSPPAEARPRRRFLAGLSLRPVLAGLAVVLLLAVAVTGYSLQQRR